MSVCDLRISKFVLKISGGKRELPKCYIAACYIAALFWGIAEALPQTSDRIISTAQAAQIAEQAPEVRQAKETFRRPMITLEQTTPEHFRFSVRETTIAPVGDGVLRDLYVDRLTGKAFRDVDHRNEVSTILLRSLRQHFLSPPIGGIVDVRSNDFLETFRLLKSPAKYSIWGGSLGSALIETNGRGASVTRLNPTISGQPLSGFVLDGAGPALVEAYVDSNADIAEILIEAKSSSPTMAAVLGDRFFDEISTVDAIRWKALAGSDALIVELTGQIRTTLFVDNPGRGFAACIDYNLTLPNSKPKPLFLDFYAPTVAPSGEALSQTITRRIMSCLRTSEALYWVTTGTYPTVRFSLLN